MADEQLNGRELDAEVAEKVFDWYMVTIDGSRYRSEQGELTAIPGFSKYITYAMQVVEKMRERGYLWNAQTPHGKGWEVQCYPDHSAPQGEKFKGLLPEAICFAALKAIERSE